MTENTRLEALATKHRRHIRLDECGDKVIPGKRGHLYYDGKDLCLMVIDGTVVKSSRWAALGGKVWLGDATPELIEHLAAIRKPRKTSGDSRNEPLLAPGTSSEPEMTIGTPDAKKRDK